MHFELRTSIRAMLRRPLPTLVAITTMALGLAAAIAVFTYINGFFQPFPGVDPDGLVRVQGSTDDDPFQDLSYLDFEDLAAEATGFEGLAASQPYFAAWHIDKTSRMSC